jgi:hypothetical protein
MSEVIFVVAHNQITSESLTVLPLDDVIRASKGLPCWGFAELKGEKEIGVVLCPGNRADLFKVIHDETLDLIRRVEEFVDSHEKPTTWRGRIESSTGPLAAGSSPSEASGSGQGPSEARGSGQGPSEASGSGQGLSEASRSGQGPFKASGSGQGLSQASGSGQGPSEASGSGQGPSEASGSSQGPSEASGSRPSVVNGHRPSDISRKDRLLLYQVTKLTKSAKDYDIVLLNYSQLA